MKEIKMVKSNDCSSSPRCIADDIESFGTKYDNIDRRDDVENQNDELQKVPSLLLSSSQSRDLPTISPLPSFCENMDQSTTCNMTTNIIKIEQQQSSSSLSSSLSLSLPMTSTTITCTDVKKWWSSFITGCYNSNSSSKDATTTTSLSSSSSFKMVLLTLLVLQTSFHTLVGRYTRSSVPSDELYDVNQLILVVECTKFILSCCLEYYCTNGKLLSSLYKFIIRHPIDACKTCIPSIMYVVQSTLIYTALSNLSAPLFLSLSQSKTITTALVSILMLQRSYSVTQWGCLILMSLGVIILVLDEQNQQKTEVDSPILLSSSSSGDGNNNTNSADAAAAAAVMARALLVEEKEHNLAIGLLAVIGASFSSAFAGVYFELVLSPERARKGRKRRTRRRMMNQQQLPQQDQYSKQQQQQRPKVPGPTTTTTTTTTNAVPSLWMRNMQLAFFSILVTAYQGGVFDSLLLQLQQLLHYQGQNQIDDTSTLERVLQSFATTSGGDPSAVTDVIAASTAATQQQQQETISPLLDNTKPFLFGFTIWVWIQVSLQAIGGLLVAAVMKYTDNVIKSLAVGVSVVVTASLSFLFMDQNDTKTITSQYCFGTIIIFIALYFFSNNSNKNNTPCTTSTIATTTNNDNNNCSSDGDGDDDYDEADDNNNNNVDFCTKTK